MFLLKDFILPFWNGFLVFDQKPRLLHSRDVIKSIMSCRAWHCSSSCTPSPHLYLLRLFAYLVRLSQTSKKLLITWTISAWFSLSNHSTSCDSVVGWREMCRGTTFFFNLNLCPLSKSPGLKCFVQIFLRTVGSSMFRRSNHLPNICLSLGSPILASGPLQA